MKNMLRGVNDRIGYQIKVLNLIEDFFSTLLDPFHIFADYD